MAVSSIMKEIMMVLGVDGTKLMTVVAVSVAFSGGENYGMASVNGGCDEVTDG